VERLPDLARAPLTRSSLASRMKLGGAWLLFLQACGWLPPSHAAQSRVQIRVPAGVLAAHAAELPLNLFVRRSPGTLENRGFLLATICTASSDVGTAYVASLAAETELTVWVERGYADNPGTPCGISAEQRDMIVEGPRRHPQASLRLASPRERRERLGRRRRGAMNSASLLPRTVTPKALPLPDVARDHQQQLLTKARLRAVRCPF
jgi:hypothetical protein